MVRGISRRWLGAASTVVLAAAGLAALASGQSGDPELSFTDTVLASHSGHGGGILKWYSASGSPLAYSPDGSRYVTASLAEGLLTRPHTGTTPIGQIAPADSVTRSRPAWVGNGGDAIVYERTVPGGYSELWYSWSSPYCCLVGTDLDLVPWPKGDAYLSLYAEGGSLSYPDTSDNGYVSYTVNTGGVPYVEVRDAKFNEPLMALPTSRGASDQASLSPGGSRIAFVSGNQVWWAPVSSPGS